VELLTEVSHDRMVQVLWQGEIVTMFTVDLYMRGEEISEPFESLAQESPGQNLADPNPPKDSRQVPSAGCQ
jgi:hypothetical protein